jgi:DHA1 family tetracycline resistance protein-like MFS transporter
MQITKQEQLPEENRLDFKKILPVFLIILIDLLGLTIIIPLMSLYAASYGANASTIGLLGATYPAAQFVGAPFLGRLSDRFGRKPILIISQIGTLIGFLVLGFSRSLWVVFLARLIDGLSGANISTAQAVISDSTTTRNRTQGLGLIGAAFGIGFVIGPVIGFVSLALSSNNFHVPAFVAAGFSLISILLTSFLLKETLPPEKAAHPDRKREFLLKNFLSAMKKPMIGFLLLLMFVQQLVFGEFQQLLSLFTLNRLGLNASGISILFVYTGIVIVAVQGYFIGRWSRRFGESWLIRSGLAIMAFGLFLVALTPRQPLPSYDRQALARELSGERSLPGETPPTQTLQISLPPDTNKGYSGLIWILFSMIPMAIGGGVLQPSINSLLTRNASVGEVGGMLGISAALLSGANAFAPVIGGTIFQSFGAGAPFLIGSAIMLLLFLVTSWKFRSRPGEEGSA